jgi:chemotaxis signal transduction protein
MMQGQSDVEKKNDTFKVIEFFLGNEVYAVDLSDVREVIDYTPEKIQVTSTSYIGAFSRALGTYKENIYCITMHRGEELTLLDPRRRLFTKDNGGERKNYRVLVLHPHLTRIPTGLLVDEVRNITTFSHGQVDKPSSIINRNEGMVRGIIRKGDPGGTGTKELLIWLDIPALIRQMEES